MEEVKRYTYSGTCPIGHDNSQEYDVGGELLEEITTSCDAEVEDAMPSIDGLPLCRQPVVLTPTSNPHQVT